MSAGVAAPPDFHAPSSAPLQEKPSRLTQTMSRIRPTGTHQDVGAADRLLYNIYEDPSHPSNWPAWKRHGQLITLSLMAFLANFTAAAHLTLFEPMSEYYGRSITAIANTSTYHFEVREV